MKQIVLWGSMLSLMISPFSVGAEELTAEAQLVAETQVTDTVALEEDSQIFVIGPSITVIAEPIIETANPALDVSYCGTKTIYRSGTYDQWNQPVKWPVCTAFDVRTASVAPVDFSVTSSYPMRKFEVHEDGKIVFVEKMSAGELLNRVIRGETDNQYYAFTGGEGFEYLVPMNESSVESFLGEGFEDQVVYFDDSIVYSYKIVR